MLIICPECNKEVSDKAEICIHCGYPIKNLNSINQNNEYTIIINGQSCDLSKYINDIKNKKVSAVRSMSEEYNFAQSKAFELCKLILDNQPLPKEINCEERVVPVRNIPTCPTCKSTNIQPISGTERAVSVIGLGIFSKKINKSFKCLDCKSTW